MKKALFIFVSLILAYSTDAQNDDRSIVGILPIAYSEARYKEPAADLENLVTKVFADNERLKVLDRSQINIITKELNLQKDYSFTDGITVKQNKAYGAEVLIAGNLTIINVSKNSVTTQNQKSIFTTGKNKNTGTTTNSNYNIEMKFSLQAFDVTTGRLLGQETFDPSKSDMGKYQQETKAYENAVSVNSDAITTKLQAWINKLYPPSFTIASIDERTRDNYPDIVSIVGGEVNVKVGDIIAVNEITQIDIDGKKRNKIIEIALLKVKELQGDFTQCSVQSGEDVLEDKWKKSKAKTTKLQLVVKGKTKPNIKSIFNR